MAKKEGRSSDPRLDLILYYVMDGFVDLHTVNRGIRAEAARVLLEAFSAKNNRTWETLADAEKELNECLNADFVCSGCVRDGSVVGWIGARPMYGNTTWELHPLVVHPRFQGKGIGRKLIEHLEETAANRGVGGIVLGTDDETGSTSLSTYDFDCGSVADAIERIEDFDRHPFRFYEKCGYRIVGVVPDANGPGKPDILMWKRVPGAAHVDER